MAKTETEIEIKRIESTGDNSRFSELFRKCFKQEKDSSYFQWKYFDNPSGNIIGYEAIAKGKTIGSFGATPEFYNINGEKIKVFLCAEAMVAPRFWGKKLFEQMAIKLQEDIINSQEKTFIIGFPNKLSYVELVNNLHWQTVIKECNYTFILHQYFHIRHPFISSKAVICTFTELNSELDNYFANFTTHASISKFFDAKTFQWKVFENQKNKYSVIGIKEDTKLIGICVYRKDTEKSCEISYINFKEDFQYKKYLPLFIKHIFTETSGRYIYTWKSEKGVLADAYKKTGFFVNKFSKGPFRDTFPIIIYKKDCDLPVDIADFSNYEAQPILLDY